MNADDITVDQPQPPVRVSLTRKLEQLEHGQDVAVIIALAALVVALIVAARQEGDS